MAADIPVKSPVMKAPPSVFAWNGIYVGANIGYASMKDSGDYRCVNPAGVLFGVTCDVVPGNVGPDGVIGGIQAGYNWQSNQWVYGIEADIQATSLSETFTATGPFALLGGGADPADTTTTVSEKLSWLATFRGRVGFAVKRSLWYVTGGAAVGHVKLASNLSSATANIQYPAALSDTRTGWTVGGGFEWAFADNWSVKAEGLYFDLGSVTVASGSTSITGAPIVTGFTIGRDFDLTGVIARAGVNYRFQPRVN
jgi:outer membrane immunogenic protein